MKCRYCGCTDRRACKGGCHWVLVIARVCSQCVHRHLRSGHCIEVRVEMGSQYAEALFKSGLSEAHRAAIEQVARNKGLKAPFETALVSMDFDERKETWLVSEARAWG